MMVKADHSLLQCYQNQRIVVTGSTGYIATGFINALRDVDCQIVRLSRPGASFRPINGRLHTEEITGDLGDPLVWERALPEAALVFHFAAQTSANKAKSDPAADYTANVRPLLTLLETCRHQGWQPAVIFASTVTAAGLTPHLPVDESQRDDPMTVYCIHKLLGEHYLKYYAQEQWVRGVTLRLANVYGPGPDSSSSDRGILNQMIRKALAQEPLTIYGEGSYIRDYIYIDDVVNAFLYAGACAEALNGRHYIIGSGRGCTIKEAVNLVAEAVHRRLGALPPVVQVPPPEQLLAIEKRNFVADPTRFNQITNWQAAVTLEAGIAATIDSFDSLGIDGV